MTNEYQISQCRLTADCGTTEFRTVLIEGKPCPVTVNKIVLDSVFKTSEEENDYVQDSAIFLNHIVYADPKRTVWREDQFYSLPGGESFYFRISHTLERQAGPLAEEDIKFSILGLNGDLRASFVLDFKEVKIKNISIEEKEPLVEVPNLAAGPTENKGKQKEEDPNLKFEKSSKVGFWRTHLPLPRLSKSSNDASSSSCSSPSPGKG